MLNPLLRTLVKVAVASLIVGSVLAHFGITADMLLKESGLSMKASRSSRGTASRGPRPTCCWAR